MKIYAKKHLEIRDFCFITKVIFLVLFHMVEILYVLKLSVHKNCAYTTGAKNKIVKNLTIKTDGGTRPLKWTITGNGDKRTGNYLRIL